MVFYFCLFRNTPQKTDIEEAKIRKEKKKAGKETEKRLKKERK